MFVGNLLGLSECIKDLVFINSIIIGKNKEYFDTYITQLKNLLISMWNKKIKNKNITNALTVLKKLANIS